VSDITEEPILPQPKKARAARRRKKRRGSPRSNLDALNARRYEEAAARRALPTATPNRENPAHSTIQDFVTGRQYLGLSPTSYPRTLQKAMHGLTRADQELSDHKSRTPTVTVVLPVYNERETLAALAARLIPVLDRVVGDAFEVLFVDDGSHDGSAEILDAFHERDQRLKVIHFSRNFGHQAALQAGLDEARGDAVIMMDADLQDPPEVLEQFITRWREGYSVVYAIRRKRKEGVFKRTAYALFYRSMKAISEIDVPLDAGDFCLLDRRVVDILVSLHERNRFLRGLRSWVGFRQVGVEYDRDTRHAGEPKYTLRKLVGLALSGYVGFSAMPLRASVWLGMLAAASGFLFALWAVLTRLAGIYSPRGWASTLAIVLFLGGIQLLMLGIIGEYLSRVYDEVRARPLYIVRSRVGIEELKRGYR
jgi:polyisoprenyl-phosphate glycosyltransferase